MLANVAAGSVSTIVLGSALSTTVPGSQPNRTVIIASDDSIDADARDEYW